MSIVVMKFGGSSVADADKIRAAASRAIDARKDGHQVVMVVSAMGDTTDDLVALAKQIADNPPKREMDQLLATGEQVTIGLMAMALESLGAPAISFTAGQIGMVTDDVHTKARIKRIDERRIHEQLAGGQDRHRRRFPGRHAEDGDVTTLGRGGSNVTLVAIAAVLKADMCENYTDVDGIYTADPRIVPTARKIDVISYDEMLELACLGASVLHNPGRGVRQEIQRPDPRPQQPERSQRNHDRRGDTVMEHIVVSGAALKEKLARVTLTQRAQPPGQRGEDFRDIAGRRTSSSTTSSRTHQRQHREHQPSPSNMATWPTSSVVESLQGAWRATPAFTRTIWPRSAWSAWACECTPAWRSRCSGPGQGGRQHPEHHHQRDQDLLPHRPQGGQRGPPPGA